MMLWACKILFLSLPNNAISRNFHFRDDIIPNIFDISKKNGDLKYNLFLVKTKQKVCSILIERQPRK